MSILALSLAACGGGGSSPSSSNNNNPPPPPATQYAVGGSVTGLSGTGLVLQDNGGDNLAVSASGPFTFATKLNSGAAYNVTVATQPSGQTCTVANGTGTISADVTNVAVSCTNAASGVKIGGTVTGLTGTGLVLLDNGGDNLSVTQNGAFTFATPVTTGAAYAVTVGTQPGAPAQNCTVTNGSGTAGSTDVSNVVVNCPGVGKFAYTATNITNGMIYAYTIDSSTGALTQAGTPTADGSHPLAVSLAPNGKFAYSASDNGTKINAFTIDQTSGALTPVGSPFPTGFTTGSTYPDIAVDSKSAHLYLASAGDAEVAAFTIQSDGSLTQLPTVAAGANAGGIPAFSPDGNYLYVVDQSTTGGVSGYSIGADGSLTPLAGSPFPTGSNPYWISFTPDGKYAYVSNSGTTTISAYSVTAGVLTPLSTPTFSTPDGNPKDLTIDPAGTHLYVPVTNGNSPGYVDVYTINADGTLTPVTTGGPWMVGIGPRFVTIDPTGRFAYVASAGSTGTGIYGFTIDSTTGALTAMPTSPFDTLVAGTEPQFVTVDPSGNFAYAANQGTGTISGFKIDQTTGALAGVPNSPYTVGPQPAFVSVSPEAPGIRD